MRLSEAVYCICVSDPNKTEACIRHGKSRSPGAAHQREEAVKERRISEEKARYDQGFPVSRARQGKRQGTLTSPGENRRVLLCRLNTKISARSA